MTIKELILDSEAKQKLGISYVDEEFLGFSGREDFWIEKFSNGNINFRISSDEGPIFFSLNKDQVETLIKWLNEKTFV